MDKQFDVIVVGGGMVGATVFIKELLKGTRVSFH